MATTITGSLPRRWHRQRQERSAGVAVSPLGPRQALVRDSLVVLCALCVVGLVQLIILSSMQQRSAQRRLFEIYRAQLAQTTAPVGPADFEGRELSLGDPVSYLDIPSIGLRQVVVEGTSAATLTSGPGHRRDSPLPGQPGVTIMMGRRASFGGPFARIDELEEGAVIRATTGQGQHEYRVIGVRREGDPVPAPIGGSAGRMVLATAGGPPYQPRGVLRVDAELEGDVQAAPPRLVSAQSLPAAEQMLATDSSRLWSLALWLQGLVVVIVGAVWTWHRWGRARAWVVFLPILVLMSLQVSNAAVLLLPNLL